VFVFFGSIITAQNVLDCSGLMIFSMAAPNMIGWYILAPKVKRTMNDYFAKL
jgi:AGCS family alanine or glycine:cation symporter